jgi:membrane fusion protein, multidrug efflux system
LKVLLMPSIRRTLSIVTLAFFVTACGQGGEQKAAPAKSAGGAGAPPSGMPPPEVDVIVVQPGQAAITRELAGRLAATRTAQVRARIEGIVEKRLFAEGSDVKEGQALYQIDARNYQSAFDAAKAGREAAHLTVSRYKPLLEISAISQQEFDLANAKLKQADAALTRATLDLENTTVPAPISGRIGRSFVTEGALVGRGEATPLAVIEQIDPIYVNFTQSGADVLRVQQQLKAGKLRPVKAANIELLLEDGSVYPGKGQLVFSDLAVDPATGSVSLRAEFPNVQRELLPGSFVRVRFPEAVADNVILVPQRAVQTGPMGQFVSVVNGEGKVVATPIVTRGTSGQNFIVVQGLKGGEQVIVNGLQKARPGSVARPVVLGQK